MTQQDRSSKVNVLDSSEPDSFSLRLIGRQPILNANSDLIGHELLFRHSAANRFTGDSETATQQVIENYLLFIPEANQGLAFINCTRQTLVSKIVTLLPKQSVVLEILETIDADSEVVESCRVLRSMGYRFALDDFSPIESRLPFLEFADYIKVDFRASLHEERKEIYAIAMGCGAQLIAEKIETQSEMEMARSEGCTLFQGYFFSKPIIVSQRRIPQNQMTYILLLSALSAERPDLLEIERLFRGDVSLCYLLLRLANSALLKAASPIISIRDALMRLGETEVRKLVTTSFAGMFANTHSEALVRMMLERARLCELLSTVTLENPGKLYLLGMLSLLDALMQVPMTEVLKSVPLDADTKAALSGQPSKIGVALDLVQCLESGNWSSCDESVRKLMLTEDQLLVCYADSVHWASNVMCITS